MWQATCKTNKGREKATKNKEKVTCNEQKVMNNKQKVTNSEQKARSNKQKVTSIVKMANAIGSEQKKQSKLRKWAYKDLLHEPIYIK